MKNSTKIYLAKKGWNHHELKKAESVLNKKSRHHARFSKLVLFSSLILVLFGNVVIAILLIPLLVFLKSYALYGIIVLLGISIGFLYNLLLNDIGELEKKYHLLANITLPIIALINMFLMVSSVNKFISEKKFSSFSYDPWVISILFTVAFLIPYLFNIIKNYIQMNKNQSTN